MTVVLAGTVNLSAQILPDLIVQILPPSQAVINGIPTNRGGLVGVASWGPANVATTCGSYAQFAAQFGPLAVRKYDLGTHLAVAVLQGGSDFRVVRVTDGSDTAATGTATSGIAYTSKYTGTLGNSTVVLHQVGSRVGTVRVIVSLGSLTEVYDNIGLGLTGNPLLVAIANAINSGASALRGPSQIVVASAGAATAAPGTATVTLSGGTDGAAGVTALTLVGVDGAARSGMYCLRGTQASLLVLCDNDTLSTWTSIIPFAQSEGMLGIVAGPSGDTVANGTASKVSAGVDDPWLYAALGDYPYYADPVNGVIRPVAPSAHLLGRAMNSAPQVSPLNKPLYGIAGTQRLGSVGSSQSNSYSRAELAQIAGAGMEVITTPAPGGNYFAARVGRNSSSDATRRLVSYTRLTNFLAQSFNAGAGIYLGEPISNLLFMNITGTLLAFLNNMLSQGILTALPNGGVPYTVVCNSANNPKSQTDLGIVVADVTVKYPGINETFNINLQGGSTVTITRATTATSLTSP